MKKKQFPYNILQAILLIIGGIVIFTPMFLLQEYLKKFLSEQNLNTLFGFTIILFIWGLSCFVNWKKGNKVSYSLKLPHKSSLVMLSIMIVIAFQIGINAPLGSGIRKLLDIKTQIANPFQYVPFTLVSMILLGPILEELIFRGTILKGFLSHYSVPKAIGYSSILFGLVHVLPTAIFGALLLGLYFGWVYYKTRSVGITILLHIIANLSGLLGVYLRFRLADHSAWFNIYGKYTLFLVVGSCIICILSLKSVLKKHNDLAFKLIAEFNSNVY